MATKTKDRRARIEEMRRAQARAERRKTLGFVSVAVVIGLLLIAVPVGQAILKARNDPARRPLSAFGVAPAAAGCSPIDNPKVTAAGLHIGPGTNQPTKTRARYSTVPPTSGEHFAVTASLGRKFFGPNDAPKMEELVHNLEHGYTVVWYDDTVRGAQLDTLRDLLARVAKDSPKFIVAPWDPSYGRFPAGMHIGVSTWGHRQLCGKVSGEVIGAFVKRFPPAQAPEPNGA